MASLPYKSTYRGGQMYTDSLLSKHLAQGTCLFFSKVIEKTLIPLIGTKICMCIAWCACMCQRLCIWLRGKGSLYYFHPFPCPFSYQDVSVVNRSPTSTIQYVDMSNNSSTTKNYGISYLLRKHSSQCYSRKLGCQKRATM